MVKKKVLFVTLALFGTMVVFTQQQPVVAVAPFDAISGISATDANMITRVFFIRLGNTNKVSLVDRNVVERVIQEHKFQAGDWSNKEKTAELGDALNANWIVRGEMEKFGSSILVTVQFYDIRTFQFKGGADLRLANADEAYDKIQPLVDKLVETISANPANAGPARPAAPSGKTYKVGDTGPAGGIIFYDRGFIADGWRYMEAAPTDFNAQWGGYKGTGINVSDYYDIPGTDTSVGSGKKNTQIIVDRLKQLGESNRAAQICAIMDVNGYKDWFLPSKDELDLMYKNLKQKNFGGLGTSWYWSSSQCDNRSAWLQFLSSGNQENGMKKNTHSVRAVRAF